MKKFLAILAIAGTLVACNNEADSTDDMKDSIETMADSAQNRVEDRADSTVDAIENKSDAAKDAVDSMDKKMDSIRKN